MRPEVVLLYFEGCPNVKEARKNIEEALLTAGVAALWKEADLQSPATPEAWRGFPSPTVLVEGREVGTGRKECRGTPSCRMAGAPSADKIVAALEEYGGRGR
ncbi:MAG TPA: hypothetical protein ENJ37_10235 [Deltaproteobacteria bacterium]|nr:hypothetical protein [Deltaproteobacteria bacterium]